VLHTGISSFLFDLGDTLTVSARLRDTIMSCLNSQLPDPKHRQKFIELFHREVVDRRYITNRDAVPWIEPFRQVHMQDSFGLPFDVFVEAASSILRHHISKCRRAEYTIPVLSSLERCGYKIGLVSNTTGPPEVFHEHVRMLEIDSYFGSILFSSEVGFRKPHPQIFHTALDQLSVSPEQTVFVGDNEEADIAGASSEGMTTVLLTHGLNIPSEATYVVQKSQFQNWISESQFHHRE
jgi:putative hydrolase of the HAD superfamily